MQKYLKTILLVSALAVLTFGATSVKAEDTVSLSIPDCADCPQYDFTLEGNKATTTFTVGHTDRLALPINTRIFLGERAKAEVLWNWVRNSRTTGLGMSSIYAACGLTSECGISSSRIALIATLCNNAALYRGSEDRIMCAMAAIGPEVAGRGHECRDYARCFKLIRQAMGYSQRYVAGHFGSSIFIGEGEVGHAWNEVATRDRTTGATGKYYVDSYNDVLFWVPTSSLASTTNANPPQIFAFTALLSPGSSGPEVTQVQRALGVPPTGYYGPLTKAAVRELQIANGISLTNPNIGNVGKWTMALLNQMLISQPPTSFVGTDITANPDEPMSSEDPIPTITPDPTATPPPLTVEQILAQVAKLQKQLDGMTSTPVLVPVVAPTITRISPASIVSGSDEVVLFTVDGSGFTEDSYIFFGDYMLTREVTLNSARQVEFSMGSNEFKSGTYKIRVGISAKPPIEGFSNSLSFTVYNPRPIPISLSHQSMTAGGPAFNFRVTGSNFVKGAVINFEGNPLTTRYISSTELRANNLTIANGIGRYSITVTNPPPTLPTTQTTALSFTVTAPAIPVLTITTLTPNSVVAGTGDTTVTITGTNFNNSTHAFTWFGAGNNHPLGTTVLSTTQLRVVVHAATIETAGTNRIYVANDVTRTTSNALPFTVTAAPPPATTSTPAPGSTPEPEPTATPTPEPVSTDSVTYNLNQRINLLASLIDKMRQLLALLKGQ